jgi:hypothetical protein
MEYIKIILYFYIFIIILYYLLGRRKSMQFDKDILKQAYEEELRHFGIRSNGTNRVKQLLDQIDKMTGQGRNPLTQEQLLSVIAQTNMFTTADIVAYCLQSYYDQGGEDEVSESLYSSGIERTSAYFDDAPCLPAHSDEVNKVEYIENVLFKCFSSYMIKKGYRARDIYRYMIRFGCILNPRSNIFVLLFNNLSNRYYLRSPNLDEGSEHGFTDRNMFTGQRNVVNLSSKMYSQITTSSFQNVTGQPFMLTIDYGNIITLDAHPYAYILQTLFYMRDNNVSEYEGTKIRIIQEEDLERRRQEERQRQQNELRRQKQEELNRWLEARTQGFLQAGGKGRIKSKKSKKNKMNKKMHYSRNKSRRYRQRMKSKEKR